MIKLYYLLYQIKGNNINWIVDVDVKLNKDFIKVLDLNLWIFMIYIILYNIFNKIIIQIIIQIMIQILIYQIFLY